MAVGQPQVVIETALTTAYSASLVWTEVTSFFANEDGSPIQIKRGAQYELDTTDTGTATVPLRNLFDEWNPSNPNSPFYGYLGPNMPWRISAVYDNVTYRLFTGFWEIGQKVWKNSTWYGIAPIQLVDAFKTVVNRVLPPSYNNQVLTLKPSAYMRWDAASGGPGNDASGNSGNTVSENAGTATKSSVASLTNTSTDTATQIHDAHTFAPTNNAYGAQDTYHGTLPLNGPTSFETWLKVTAWTGTTAASMQIYFGDGGSNEGFVVLQDPTTGSTPRLYMKQNAINYSVQVLTLGSTYHLVYTRDASGHATLYVNGVSVFTHTDAGYTYAQAGVQAGHSITGGAGTDTTQALTYTFDESLVYQTVLTANQVKANYVAGTSRRDYPSQATDQRIIQLLADSNWPTGKQIIDTGSVTMNPSGSLSGAIAIDQIFTAVNTEHGHIFVNGNGDIVFQNRTHRSTSPNNYSLLTLSETGVPFEGGVTFTDDDQRVFNDIQVTATADPTNSASTSYLSIADDTPSQGQYGLRSMSLSLPFANQADADTLSALILSQTKTPRQRVETISVDLRSKPQYTPFVLAREIGDTVTVNKINSTLTPYSVKCWIEGIEYQIDSNKFVVTFHLDPIV